MIDPRVISDLPRVLSFRAPADPRGALRRRARALLLSRIEALFCRAAPAEAWATFQEGFAALSPAGQRRLLSAPALWGQILQDLESDVEPFLERVEREAARRAPPALRLPQGAEIDGVSPWATTRIPNVVERCDPYSDDELRAVAARLQAAARALPGLCPHASRLVRAFAQVVVIRRDPEHPERFLSESTEGVLGRVVLLNPHLPQVSAPDLIEALVHESVHAFLSTVELFEPFIPDRLAADGLELRSPWTGNALDAQRLTHATLVWYSLGHLWRQAGLPARAQAADAGFHELDHLLPALEPVLSPPTFTLLRGLRPGS